MIHIAYIGLGSNLGPREKNITAALGALEATRGVTVMKVSSLYETEPVGGPADQDKFINAVVKVETTLTARRLLEVCLHLENALGRKRGERWGPRTIDLDLLAYDDELHADADLTIPHALLHERRFVLEPLVEIEPEWMHPILEQTAQELLEALPPAEENAES